VYKIEEDFKFYLDAKELLSKKYPDKYILIRHKKIVAVFGSYLAAFKFAEGEFPNSEYYIQYCTPAG
jgi:hypothetical protein